MFYRKKQNKSGSTSVQVLKKRDGKNVLVKTIGSSSNFNEIIMLCTKAKAYIADAQHQMSLDIDFENNGHWFSNVFEQVKSIRLLGPELILGKLFDQIGFAQVSDQIFRDLVITRLIFPSSKLQTTRYLLDYRNINYNIQKVYRYLDKLHDTQKQLVEQISYDHTLSVLGGSMSMVFYDVTTLYFESEKEDDLRIVGFSKDGKHKHPQILLGLLVSIDGYPLAYNIFKGNTYEGHTLLPVIDAFKKRFKLDHLVIIADAGLLTNKNVGELIEKGYSFILGARIKSEKSNIQHKILEKPLANGQNQIIEKENGLKLVVNYTHSRAKKDRFNREKGLKRLEKQINSGKLTKSNINNRGYNKYLKLEGDINISLDMDKFNQDAKWDGLKGYLTNTNLRPKELLGNYRELWKIEKAFRISKTDLRIRPVYHRLENRIAAHICISFVAYKIYKELERQLKVLNSDISVERAIEISKTIYGIIFEHPSTKEKKEMVFAKNQQQKNLLELFKIPLGDPNG